MQVDELHRSSSIPIECVEKCEQELQAPRYYRAW
jgi:hypothetical protein